MKEDNNVAIGSSRLIGFVAYQRVLYTTLVNQIDAVHPQRVR